jgi:diguanylate cyclase
VNAPAESADWRKKYLDSLKSLESEEQRFRTMEATLKRIAGRLCIASLGQSSQLDTELKKLQTSLRGEITSEQLDGFMPAITAAINALDDPAPPPSTTLAAAAPTTQTSAAASPVVIDDRVRATLAAMLAELKRDVELGKQAEALDAKLGASLTGATLADVLSPLSELVGQRIQRIEFAKREIEVLLNQMVDKLDEIGQFISDNAQNQNQTLESNESLNSHLTGEMRAMVESVESAQDLQQIRTQVRTRLDTIGKHLHEFRDRETSRVQVMQQRNEQMRSRMAELEAEAMRLSDQLKDEQRLASIDVLTKIPNRLAYDRRIEEELQRWQRFSQPTCIAAWDIDLFKKINDTFGHRAGDRVLLTVARCLASRIRATDFLARYGGEEFVTILSGTQLNDAMKLVEGMRSAVSELRFHFGDKVVSVTISCGVTALQNDDTSGTAFERADKALYYAKDKGRNQAVSG